jgi:hypothetical protein
MWCVQGIEEPLSKKDDKNIRHLSHSVGRKSDNNHLGYQNFEKNSLSTPNEGTIMMTTMV